MASHDWELKELDGGHVGAYSVWECRRCYATNHSCPDLGAKEPGRESFLACGCGSEVTELSEDCDEAFHWVRHHYLDDCPNAKCLNCKLRRREHNRTGNVPYSGCNHFIPAQIFAMEQEEDKRKYGDG